MTTTWIWTAGAGWDSRARERFLQEHLRLVHLVARRLSRVAAARTRYDELVSSGTIGLMHALQSFDSRRGHAFSTYAVPRIRGAILDEMRRADDVPRGLRAKRRVLARSRDTLAATLGRAPHQREIADHLGVDIETVWKWQVESACCASLSLELASSEGDDAAAARRHTLRTPADPGAPVDEAVNRELVIRIVHRAMAALDDRERRVLTLYYFEELTLREIGRLLGVTESRASQIRTRALARLRDRLASVRDAVT
jgi:RNA polymerase sigma factor for flagellar operon FliA